MKKFFAILPIVFALCFSPLAVRGAGANSAQRYWEGRAAGGLVVVTEECPVTVEKEKLTFEIPAFPEMYYATEEEFSGYRASVTAEYTFYNPEEYDAAMKLVFPFGMTFYNAVTYLGEPFDDTARYQITADGVPVKKEIRYTYSPYSFSLGEDLSKISDGYREHAFYSPERTVTQYTFVAETAETGDLEAVFFIPSDEDTRVLLSEYANKTVQGGEEVGIDVKNGEEISFLVIGEKDFVPEGTLYRGFPGNDAEKVPGTLTMVKSSKMTFEEFVFSSFSLPEGKFARNDWYNAAVDYLDDNTNNGSVVWTGAAYNFADSLLRWYEYDLTVPAGGRTVNSVSAPLYPSIDADYSPAVYSYEYLLSPAASWADFGTLEISINTPYYLLWSGGFTAKEGGYAYFSDSLPQGELVFFLCESEDPEWQNNGSWWLTALIVALFVVALLILFAAIAGLIVLIVFAVKALTAKN